MQNRLGESSGIRHERLSRIAALLKGLKPDLVCLQEALIGDYQYLCEKLAPVASAYKPRDDGERLGEGNPIFVLSKTWRMAEAWHFWLSRTPHQPSRSWGAKHRRLASVMRLEAPRGGDLCLANVHLDHASRVARRESIKLIQRKLGECSDDGSETVLCGDFNLRPAGVQACGLVGEPNAEGGLVLHDAAQADAHQALLPTYLGWGPLRFFAARVDHCLLSAGLACKRYVVHDPQLDGEWLSDHRVVLADLMLSPS